MPPPAPSQRSEDRSEDATACLLSLAKGDGSARSQLFEIIEDPGNVYEHIWQPNDLVMWDNLASLHARTDWLDSERRELRRCTTLGEALG